MLYLNKIARLIIPFFQVLVILFIINTSIHEHYHKLSTGLIVKHSHPYDNSKEDNSCPIKKHHHSESELFLLEQIFNTVFWINLFILSLILLYNETGTIAFPLIIPYKKNDLYFLRNYHAPPDTSY